MIKDIDKKLKSAHVKRTDIFLIVLFVILSFIPNIVFYSKDKAQTGDIKYLEIQVNGELYKKIKLTGKTDTEEIEIKNGENRNIVLIDKETVSMKESSCKDQICVHSRPITSKGETIVCLPNKVVLEIKGGSSSDEDIRTF